MHHALTAFYRWCTHTTLGHWLANSTWGFAVVETVHLLALALLLGTIVVINASILGFGFSRPTRELVGELKPYWLTVLLVMVATGIPMFMSAASHYAQNPAFLIKMPLLITASLLQLTFFRFPGLYERSRWGKPMAALTLLCWFSIAYAGRAIAFTNLFGV